MLLPWAQPDHKMQPPAALQILPLAALALVFSIVALLAWIQSPASRPRVLRLAFSACLILMPITAATLIAGCGGGSSSPAPPPPPASTPTGTSMITVTATSGSTTAPIQLTLVVQ
jgi:hypothetical protein